MEVNVIVNRWDGKAFRYPHAWCWACGKPGTLAEIIHPVGQALLVRLCASCLQKALTAVQKATLEDATRGD